MEMPKPGPAHVQLAKLAGNWSGEEQIAPSPFDPQGGPAHGKVNNRVGLEGWCVIQDYEQTRGGKLSFRGHGVFSIDPRTHGPVMHWYDSMGGGPQVFEGGWKGDVLALTSVGHMRHIRCTFDVGGGGYKFAMDVSPDGKQWMSFMSGTYRKA